MFELSLRRAFDLTVAGIAILVSAPLIALAAIAIKVDSSGPALFRQQRIGRGRQPIETLKLRTMGVGADRAGPQVTADRDPRITRVGRWLRKTKIDELPQLWNVLRGDMSIVGPRPEVPRYVATYRAEWEELFNVRPGLTDTASLTFRNEEELLSHAHDRERAYLEIIMPIKLSIALEGVAQSSVKHDLRVIVLTVFSVVRGQSIGQDILDDARRQIEVLNRKANEV